MQTLRVQLDTQAEEVETQIRMQRQANLTSAAPAPLAQLVPLSLRDTPIPVVAEARNGITSQEYPTLGQAVAQQNTRHAGATNGRHAAAQQQQPARAQAAMVLLHANKMPITELPSSYSSHVCSTTHTKGHPHCLSLL